ncbi:MAG: L,D-transpeptidase family protein, partial [Bacteroidota bacterium]|nr:L,D-transpeptidase family protein [Bacteroidota bacterium]
LNTPADQDPFRIAEPQHPQYGRLKKVLQQYIDFQEKGGWQKLSGITRLKLGDTSDNVLKLREYLIVSGDLASGPSNFYNPKVFDGTLEMAVRSFQARHGLEADGIVAGGTLEAINKSAAERVKQIQVNMERWRLIPRDMPDTFILVNVPEYKLFIYENNKNAMEMRVVVGKEFNSTPIFRDELEYIVFSPYWNVPKSILLEEVLPAVYRDPSFLTKNHMEVVEGYSDEAVRVNFWQVPWHQADEDNFPYRIRQRPGPKNPLGLVKFIFPNQHSIYLHDTPTDYLFNRVKRTYSHGCIRIERPMDMAKYLLKNQKGWDENKIQKAMNAGEELYINVRPKVPVFILYFTAWVDGQGRVNFRNDIYGYDARLAAAL